MSKPFMIRIPHRLGKDEAVRRLKSGLGNALGQFSHVLSVQEQVWTDDHLQFRVGALGQYAAGTIDVAEDYVELVVTLPWLLERFADKFLPLIRDRGTLLLDKK
jgi:hypothetical protein